MDTSKNEKNKSAELWDPIARIGLVLAIIANLLAILKIIGAI